ncbi:hypothetical protein BGZ65_001978 [Modicella reniformis]|uniref:Uncharacterized protein n=1 Tax=Modicella reniformis TaxID=1440133 RepID=A0A9P6SQY0_9FUNG|nr:hypothetical protein BGZ65_001978 [Modicella reniformis]
MILESPPLVNLTPLTQIHEVPIHIHHPIHPNSANKHKRLGLQMLNELNRIEMFVTKIESVGKHEETSAELTKAIAHLEQTLYAYELENGQANRLEHTTGRMMLQRYMNRTGLAEMFPKSSEYLGFEPILQGGSFIEAHFRQMATINQLVSIALQLQNDLKLSNHKFMAHQVALLYQCINQAGPQFSRKYKSRVEENFSALKEASNMSDEPHLPIELHAWLTDLTTDIVSEALFSGRPMSQQTPDAPHLSDYINRVSSGNSLDEPAAAK